MRQWLFQLSSDHFLKEMSAGCAASPWPKSKTNTTTTLMPLLLPAVDSAGKRQTRFFEIIAFPLRQREADVNMDHLLQKLKKLFGTGGQFIEKKANQFHGATAE